MKKIKLRLAGMHCASCAMNIQRSIGKVSGVREVRANSINNLCFVEAEDNASEEDMKKAVAHVGYKVLSLEKQ